MGTPRFRLLDATLNPPVLAADEEDAASQALPWVLLEVEAYVAKRENATTAFFETWDRKQIQVTLCPRRPPRVSYLCVHSPDAEIHVEPKILATEDDLVLLRIAIGRQEDVTDNLEYYVYQADDGSGRPALTHLPQPPRPYRFDSSNMGIMRCRTDHCSDDGCRQEFVVAGLSDAPDDYPEGDFVLCLYKSKDKVWTKSIVSLDEQQRRQYGSDFDHDNTKMIAIGGDAGTMGFVDLWRGILFCDVLQEEGEAIPPLRYVPLPVTRPKKKLRGEPRLCRDVAVVDGRLKYVELQLHWKNSVVVRGARLKDGWIAATYSKAATSSLEDTWSKDYEVDSNCMNFKNDPLTKLLPKMFNDEGMPLPPFKRLDVCQPTLALDHHDTVYFMTKFERQDAKAWVVVVDMKKKVLQAVCPFSAERNTFINFAYMHSRISSHLYPLSLTTSQLMCY
ncbi:unnamed protein product [Urochloa decumbens]|uniref:DUF1618 domain-containing protein n=1 Tax=Urochloa decumbens TaxID=240449 RepID=A0ABC9FS55_9POAL